MSTRKRPPRPPSSEESSRESSNFDFSPLEEDELNSISDEDLDRLLDDTSDPSSGRFGRIATYTGLAMLVIVGVLILAELPMLSLSVAAVDPSIGLGILGVLLAFIGYGLFAGRRTKKKSTSTESDTKESDTEEAEEEEDNTLRRSSEKKLMGVCGGLAEYFGLDPSMVRVAFVLALVFSGGPMFLVYFGMAYVMPPPLDE